MSAVKTHHSHEQMVSRLTDEQAMRICEDMEAWERTTRTGVCFPATGSHKYEVKAVTTPLAGTGKRVRTYYVTSIAHLLHELNEHSDFIQKVRTGWYNTVKGSYVTAHYVERLY